MANCWFRMFAAKNCISAMVVGNGLLAKTFSDYSLNNDVIIFASGVSNSKLTDPTAYRREQNLLEKTITDNPGKLLVYFSTCSVLDKSLTGEPYIQHKFLIEKLIHDTVEHYLIFRLSNLVGHGGNPKTIMNYLVHVVKHHIHFELWSNSSRNILDVDDAFTLMHHFIQSGETNAIINIANPVSYPTITIVQEVEAFTRCKADYELVPKGEHYFIDTIAVEHVAPKLHIDFSGNYLQGILQKYYAS